MLVSCSQLTSTTKLSVFFLKFEKTAHGLRVNETKPDTENACIWNYLGFRVNNKSKCDEMAMFRVSLHNLDFYSPVSNNTGVLIKVGRGLKNVP